MKKQKPMDFGAAMKYAQALADKFTDNKRGEEQALGYAEATGCLIVRLALALAGMPQPDEIRKAD